MYSGRMHSSIPPQQLDPTNPFVWGIIVYFKCLDVLTSTIVKLLSDFLQLVWQPSNQTMVAKYTGCSVQRTG